MFVKILHSPYFDLLVAKVNLNINSTREPRTRLLNL